MVVGEPFCCQQKAHQANVSNSVSSVSVKFGKKELKVDHKPFSLPLLPRELGVLQVKHKIFSPGEELSKKYLFSSANFI